jgi:hypothetical protein
MTGALLFKGKANKAFAGMTSAKRRAPISLVFFREVMLL